MASTNARSASNVSEAVLKEIAGLCHVSVEDIDDVYACTPLQLGIMAQPGRTYTDILVFSLASSLDLNRLCAALRQVISLNAALRTRIVDCELGLVQVVVSDGSDYRTERPSESLEQWLEYEKSSPMHLETPLFRTAIVARKLVMTVHHAIWDGWTYHAFLSDVSRIYHGEAPERHAEFKQFVKHCLSIDESEAKSFWSSKFSGQPAIYPMIEPVYSPDATSILKKQIMLNSGPSVSPALIPSYIEAAWALTAMSYTKTDSVAFGFVVSGRISQLGGLQSTLGPTVVSIPVQVNFIAKSTIKDLIKERARERRAVLASPALQYGLPKIRTLTESARITGGFSTLLNIFSPTEELSYAEDIKFEYQHDRHSPSCLGLVFILSPIGISVEATFDSKVVCERQMSRVLNQFEHILLLLIQSPATTKLEQLQLLCTHDRRELLAWNKTIPETPQKCLHELFSARARAQTTELSVEAHDGTVAYIELDDTSSRLAHELQRKGVGKEKAVALIFDKSLWIVVASLAIMKAGGICVPIDPAFPYDQKQAMISRSRAGILLTSSIYLEQSVGLAPCILAVNSKSVSKLPVSSQPLSDNNHPTQAAYILFTSGSTGVPKGVVLEHRNLVSSLTAFGEYLGWKQGSRVLQFASYVWGASIIEMFGTLIFGGCVCIPSQEERDSGLIGFIESKSVHSAILTPTVIRLFSPEEVTSLRTLVTAGEPIDLESVKIWGSKVRFINGWGQSETAVCSALTDVAPSSTYQNSIGKAVGCAIWIVDANDASTLVPIGTIGEIVIEGPGVARGYLADDKMTAASFIRPPSWAADQRGGLTKTHQMYRTGDLAKYNPDGSIHYIGRQDNRVKIRGQRFDLGEVERAICSCAIVRNALATVQVSTDNQEHLVAVLSLADYQLPSETPLEELPKAYESVVSQHLGSIRAYLTSKVPLYMVPTAWLVVEQLPRTPSSKLDRRLIREWLAPKDLSKSRRATVFGTTGALSPPSSDVERALQSTWSSVLSVPEHEIGRESSFIRLGGDSISAMQVTERCRKRGLQISVSTLLRNESLAGAAANCEVSRNLSDKPSVISADKISPFSLTSSQSRLLDEYLSSIGVARANAESAYPCSPVQEGILFAQLKGVKHEYLDRFIMKLTLRDAGGVLNVERIAKAWLIVCNAHPMLRTVFTSCLSTPASAFQQIVLKQTNPSISFNSVDLEADFFSSLKGFDRLHFTAAEPPHRLHITRVSQSVAYATIDINHALIDFRSMHLIAQQLGHLYTDETSIAKAPDISEYIAWLQRQREPAQKYWTDYLSGAQPCLIPTLRAEPEPQKGTVSHFDVQIQDAHRLHLFCQLYGVTVANLVQTAWSLVLRQYNGAESLTFGCLQSQQGSIECAETIVGPLLAMIVCKFDVTPSTTLLGLLKKAKEDSLCALEHAGFSLGEIHEAIGLGSSSLFNTAMSITRLWPHDVAGKCEIKVEPLAMEDNPTEYTIAVGVGYDNERIGSRLWYDSSNISRSFASQIGQTFETMLLKIVENPEQLAEALTMQLSKPSTIPSTQNITDKNALRSIGANLLSAQLEVYDPLGAGEQPHGSTTPPSANTKILSDREVKLRRLWSDVLSLPLDFINEKDNFFSIGGNSIRAMRLVNAARQAGITLTVADVFKAPTLSDMAAVSRQLVSNGKTQPTPIKAIASRPSIEELAKKHPSIRVDNVESIAKTTDLQAWTLAVGGLDGKAFNNESLLKSKVGLDVSRLTHACETTIKHHAVFRTIFVQHKGGLYQVVVKSLPGSLVTIEGNATEPPSSNENNYLPQFHLRSISDDGSICHELHLKINHALYDAISLGIIFQDLRAAYIGQALSDGPQFHDWLSHVESLDKSTSEAFWRRLLRQSSMTNLVPPRMLTSKNPAEDKTVIRVPIKSVETSYGTPSTLVQAAWALVLHHISGSQDVVFGAVSANRNLPFPGVGQVRGPCLNILPVRARLDAGLTVVSLVQQLQDQATAAIPHHHVGYRSIIHNCTDWPSWTRFSSILVYQNHEFLDQPINFGDADCDFTGHGKIGDSADIWIIAHPSSEELVIELLYSRDTISEEQASRIARTLTMVIESIPAKLVEIIG